VPALLQDLINAVKAEQADIGIAYDGDADRLGIVTDQGEIIWLDRQMMLFAQDVLRHPMLLAEHGLNQHPKPKIIFDIKCSSRLADVIRQAGAEPIMWRTGHSLIKTKMLEENAPLAGEMSGHIFFNDDWFGFDDGIYAGARLLNILSRTNQSSSQVFAALPNSVNTSELKLFMPENKKADFLSQLSAKADFGNAELITIDGLRVDFGYGWGLVRASNTSPNLILRFEADNQQNLETIQAIFRKQLLAIDNTLQLPF
jgi:phosphomannomutase / phosphoglucomutase